MEAAGTKARTFSQVVFTDTPHSYPPSTPITCCFTLTPTFQPSPRDWVGIFKVGWSTTKDYQTFVWVEPCLDVDGLEECARRQAVFKEYYLPKDEIDFYQFCYVDSSGQVRGASTPFCFKNPGEQSIESSPDDDDLLVITTQEQVEQSVREKAELQKQLDQTRAENETLKNHVQTEQREAASLKGQNEQKEREMSELQREMDEVKKENERLRSVSQQQQREMDGLKEEIQTTKQMERQQQQQQQQQHEAAEREKQSQSLNSDGASRQNEKYERAVMKINQLKEEREGLRGKVHAQTEAVSTLKSKVKEQERELLKMKDSVQLLQVDLQSSEKEKERLFAELQRSQSLTHNMDAVKRENQELCRRLSQQETPQDCADDDLRARCQDLVGQLQDAQVKLSAEREESKNIKRRAGAQERELQEVREQLEKMVTSSEQTQRKSGKQELQLREAHEAIADKDGLIEEKDGVIKLLRHEMEELARENQSLMCDIEGLRRVNAELSAAPPADPPHVQPDTTAPAAAAPATHDREPQETPEQPENLYEIIGSAAEGEGEEEEEQALVCRHCQECFPCITRHELEQHEQSHRVCPFCTMICDNMEQSVFEDHVYSHEL